MGDTGKYGWKDISSVRPLGSVPIKNTDNFQIISKEKKFYSGHKPCQATTQRTH